MQTFINRAYTHGTARLNSWYRAERNADGTVSEIRRDMLGGPDRITTYRMAGFDIDWQGNARRRFALV